MKFFENDLDTFFNTEEFAEWAWYNGDQIREKIKVIFKQNFEAIVLQETPVEGYGLVAYCKTSDVKTEYWEVLQDQTLTIPADDGTVYTIIGVHHTNFGITKLRVRE